MVYSALPYMNKFIFNIQKSLTGYVSKNIVSGMEVLAFLSMFILTIWYTKPMFWDEPGYLKEAALMYDQGISIELVRNSWNGAGPLTSFIQYLFQSITHFNVPGIRLVNEILLLFLTFVLALILKNIFNSRQYLIQAFSIISIPSIWIISGMVFSEIPAMLFSIAGVGLLLFVVNPERINKNVVQYNLKLYLLAVMGGLLFGISIVGRQTLLCLYIAFPVLIIHNLKNIRFFLTFIFSSLIFPVLLFSIWGGIVAPNVQHKVGEGFSLAIGFMTYAYAAGFIALIAPQFLCFNKSRKIIFASILSLISLNIATQMVRIERFEYQASFLPSAIYEVYVNIFTSIVITLGLLFLFSIFRHLWNNRNHQINLFLGFSALLVCSTPIKLTHFFTSRYTAIAIPFIILFTDQYNNGERMIWKLLRLTVGAVAGFFILRNFYLDPNI